MTNVGELREILQDMMKDTREEIKNSTLDFQKEVCEERYNILKKCSDDLLNLGIKVGKRFQLEALSHELMR